MSSGGGGGGDLQWIRRACRRGCPTSLMRPFVSRIRLFGRMLGCAEAGFLCCSCGPQFAPPPWPKLPCLPPRIQLVAVAASGWPAMAAAAAAKPIGERPVPPPSPASSLTLSGSQPLAAAAAGASAEASAAPPRCCFLPLEVRGWFQWIRLDSACMRVFALLTSLWFCSPPARRMDSLSLSLALCQQQRRFLSLP